MVNQIKTPKFTSVNQRVDKGIKPKIKSAVPFSEVLQNQLTGQTLKFSAHATNRLQQRSLTLDENTVARLEKAVNQAAAKGARQSLVMVDEMAFVVSITNKTVITAMTGEGQREGVFTNIDSAVIA